MVRNCDELIASYLKHKICSLGPVFLTCMNAIKDLDNYVSGITNKFVGFCMWVLPYFVNLSKFDLTYPAFPKIQI